MGSHAGRTLGSSLNTSRTSWEQNFLSTTISKTNSWNQSLVIIRYPLLFLSSPHEFSIRHLVTRPVRSSTAASASWPPLEAVAEAAVEEVEDEAVEAEAAEADEEVTEAEVVVVASCCCGLALGWCKIGKNYKSEKVYSYAG